MMNRFTTANRIDSAIRFFLYVLIFWLPYSSAVIESCVIVSLILWIVKRSLLYDFSCSNGASLKDRVVGFLRAFEPKLSFLGRPILFFIGACLLSIIGSAFFSIALRGFLTKTLEWFVICFLVTEVFTHKRHIYIAVGIFLFSAFATCLDSIIQFHITHKDIFSGKIIARGGATAAFKHPNSLGGYLTFVVLPIIACTFLYRGKKTIRYLFACFSACAIWAAVISFSRGAWMGITAGTLFLLFLIKKKWLFYVALFLTVFVGFIAFFTPIDTKQRFRIDAESFYETMQWRSGLWMDSLAVIKDRPISGHGLNTFMRLFQVYRRKYLDYHGYGPTYAHNCYLQIAVETGALGLICFLWILWRFFRRIMKTIKSSYQSGDANLRIILIGLLSGIFAFLTHSFLDTNLYSLQLSALLWLMVGMAMSIFNLLSQSDIYGKKIGQ